MTGQEALVILCRKRHEQAGAQGEVQACQP